jgi:PadR family transcriptional regulator, regulatory protein PadR
MGPRRNPRFVNGVPELLVLKLLSQQEMYGYQIARAILTETRQALAFGEGCIYPLLRSLRKRGLLTSRRQQFDGRTRLYYAASPKGRERLREIEGEWKRIASGVTWVLDGSPRA